MVKMEHDVSIYLAVVNSLSLVVQYETLWSFPRHSCCRVLLQDTSTMSGMFAMPMFATVSQEVNLVSVKSLELVRHVSRLASCVSYRLNYIFEKRVAGFDRTIVSCIALPIVPLFV